ncbi:DUF1194 domain-containing protein [Labrenzia sp. PHM005]|uniref:DUF1194 domain-containing protein n=1 Tax=Labrenzia sp. PHM005 TaxID=2590016 RepID=UPI0011407A2A|nr:DUF1194 domain-containing protein [Labrenzia sp. PHM005]QDG78406.1 DUF1194 domain-containing protein [Labrenzia sp. PHM005]
MAEAKLQRFLSKYLRSGHRKGLASGWKTMIGGLAILGSSTTGHACSLALVLAMDSSASVDAREYHLQINGLADAVQDPDVINAIEAVGGIYLTSFEWSGRYQQVEQLGWRLLDNTDSARTAASIIRQAPRGYTEFPTALGYALGHAAVLMQRAPTHCHRKVIDVAGDGINNDGFGPDSAYKAFDFENVTVNGLVIGSPDTIPVDYYYREVIKGPGAFVEIASTFDDYADAMKRKLIREIIGNGLAAAD